eukprot:651737-Prorocentrum_minimum.AAC.2
MYSQALTLLLLLTMFTYLLSLCFHPQALRNDGRAALRARHCGEPLRRDPGGGHIRGRIGQIGGSAPPSNPLRRGGGRPKCGRGGAGVVPRAGGHRSGK